VVSPPHHGDELSMSNKVAARFVTLGVENVVDLSRYGPDAETARSNHGNFADATASAGTGRRPQGQDHAA
jgi:hypothetical protein